MTQKSEAADETIDTASLGMKPSGKMTNSLPKLRSKK